MMPPEEYGFDFEEENYEEFMEDEEALEALREMESIHPKEKSPPKSAGRSPEKKRPRLSTPPKMVALEDITNLEMNETEESPMETTSFHIPRLGERKIYRRIPLEGDYQSFTMSDGERFYVKLRDSSEELGVSRPKLVTGLCGESYSSLLEQAIQEQLRIQAANSIVETLNDDSGIDFASSDEDSSGSIGRLWVDKFKPRSYMQLLSDDGTNRTLLHWLKLWDKAVFNIDPPKKAPPKTTPEGDAKNDFAKKKFVSNNELIEELDDTNRPGQKTALLYGPPGLGKTTLAHVVATHAGYNVVEINASDDRSLAAFKVKLEAATQMKSVSNADKRPNCLVIDEIDGAPAATINYLVNLLNGKSKKTSGSKKQQESMLLRPIICICNDLYVPALRPLRQISLLLQFPPTSSQRLAQRLSFISAKEQLKTDLTALMALCEKSGNDIRSCLSTLQFFKSKGRRMSSMDVHRTFVGNKDTQKSHFSVWQDLFQLPRASSKRKFDQEKSAAATESRFQNSLRMVMACGDYEKLQQGVFENYLNAKFKDTRMQNVQLGQDWFCFFDIIHQHIMHSQVYTTMAYLPYNFVATHLLFAASGRFKVTYPTQAFETKSALLKSNQIVESLYADMTPGVRCYTSMTSLVRDILPCLLHIIQPNLRPVNTQLFTKSEKELLEKVIATFLAYSLNFVQERSVEGQYFYKLDPNIEAVCYFKDIQHQQLPYAIKQLIAHEVDKERMRRSEDSVPTTSSAYTAAIAKPKDEKEKELPNHLRQKLQVKQVEIKEHVPVDFFGRRIQPKPLDPAKEAAKKANDIIISDVWFKFKEGYNNAVRKNIRMKDLF